MHSEVAQLQVLLEGVPLPASRDELIRYAREQNGGRLAWLLDRLPERQYRSLDEVGEALVPAQPSWDEEAGEPRAESGLPPGGDDYTNPRPIPGEIRRG